MADSNPNISPSTTRADGTKRKERKIRPGHKPAAEVPKYIPPRRRGRSISGLIEGFSSLQINSQDNRTIKNDQYKPASRHHEIVKDEGNKDLSRLDE